MNCRHVSRLLSEGKPLDASARAHLAECTSCRALVEASLKPAQTLDAAKLEAYKRVIKENLTVVRPVASDRQLTFVLLALFFCFSIFAAFPAGMHGLRVLGWTQMLVYYGVIVLTALFAASAVVQEMVPGAKRYFNPRVALAIEVVALIATVALLFRSLSVARFVQSGRGCLLLGSECALASGLLFLFILKNGWFISPVRAGIVTGFFSGLAGIAVLAMHCPVLSTPHILVWHFSVLPLGTLAGGFIGYLAQKFGKRNF